MKTLAKTGSAFGLHIGVAFGVTYAMTGSVMAGSLTALLEAGCNVAANHVHERCWRRADKA